MSSLADKLYRAFVLGEELGDDWGEEALETARMRGMSLDEVVLEAVEEAAPKIMAAPPLVQSHRALNQMPRAA